MNMGFNENLKLLLLEKNMKLADLCRMAGIQTSLMSEYI
ncbi:helix-turn-helix domain-containing protein, partial [Eggerthella lenta]